MTESKKAELAQKVPRMWVVVIHYENLMSAEDEGGIIDSYEETFYCPTPTSIRNKVMHSIISALLGDPEFSGFIFDYGDEKFNTLLGRAVSEGSVEIESPGEVKTVITLEIDETCAEYIGRTAVPGRPTVLADPNFIELTALRKLGTGVSPSLELDYETDADDGSIGAFGQGIDLIYLRADSILGISEESNFVRRIDIDPEQLVAGSVIHTSCPGMKTVRVIESPAVVLSRLGAVASEREEILKLKGQM